MRSKRWEKYKINILVIGRMTESTGLMLSALRKHWPQVKFIAEKKDRLSIFKGWIEKKGIFVALDRLIFLMLMAWQKEMTKLISFLPIVRATPTSCDFEFSSFNDFDKINSFLNDCDLIVLSGCSLVPRAVLEKIDRPIINVHCGITPAYRGVHGGFWALNQKDNNNFGSTIHFVDSGIDTGQIIEQVTIEPVSSDNYINASFTQLRAALPCLVRQIQTFEQRGFFEYHYRGSNEEKSRVWSHPGLFKRH